MFILTILNVVALITLIILTIGVFNLFKTEPRESIQVCLFLKISILIEILLIIISIYLPLTMQPPLEYSKLVTAPILIGLIFLSFVLLYLKKLSCYILFPIISLGVTASLFRIYSSFQLDLTNLF